MSKLFPNAIMRIRTPYRFDIVGGFLHPDSLKQARRRHACGECNLEEIHRIENREIATLIAREEAVDLPSVTDGEFRRTWWHLDFLFELLGVELAEAEEYSTKFRAHIHRPATLKITNKIEFPNVYPFLTHFEALQGEVGGHPVRFTIPSPSMLHLITCMCTPNPQLVERYAGRNDLLLADITAAYVKAVNTPYGAGYRILQLDDISWSEFCSGEKRALYQAQRMDVDATARSYVKVLGDIHAATPADMVLTMRVCHGNFRSIWFSSGDYEPVAEILFGGRNVDGFLLEYDSDHADNFKPPRFIKNQQVVLGLITSKSGELEDRGTIIGRIKEAAQYVDTNRLCLGPQYGFTSTEGDSVLAEEERWKKLALIRSIVEEMWSDA